MRLLFSSLFVPVPHRHGDFYGNEPCEKCFQKRRKHDLKRGIHKDLDRTYQQAGKEQKRELLREKR